jgi:energy-coupling factor transporter ATP-binding protein EcfA2
MKKPYSSISMQETINLISKVGDSLTVLVQGEMGIGKSSILKSLVEIYPNHIPCYIDITTKDVGDFLVPQIRTLDGTPVCSFIPNEEFGFHLNKPLILMLDEIGKASKAVMNACLRLMLERKLGIHTLPEGSIVFATTNLAVEGIGDNVPPHARNRVCVVKMRKHTGDEWRWNYAQNAGVDPVVIATVIEYPAMTASFEDYERPDMNEYINDPRVPRTAFVTFRSLEKASDILKRCRELPEDVLTHALFGVIGERATMDMMNILKLDNQMPAWSEIVNKPTTTVIPPNGAAVCLVVSKALSNVATETFDAWMTYLARMPREAQALFAMGVMSNKSPKRSIAVTNKMFTAYAVSQGYLF